MMINFTTKSRSNSPGTGIPLRWGTQSENLDGQNFNKFSRFGNFAKFSIYTFILALAFFACQPLFAQRLLITPSVMTITEGKSGSFTVVLSSEPTGDVTVDIVGRNGTNITLGRDVLIFTSLNWNQPQEVEIMAGEVADSEDHNGVLILIASGGGYTNGGVLVSPKMTRISALGETVQLEAILVDQDGTTIKDIPLEFLSDDSSIAVVDSAGMVTAVGFGVTNIVASFSSAQGRSTVIVEDPDNPVTSSSDQDVLENLYKTTGGKNWVRQDGWLTDRPISEWYGVSVDSEGRVTRLDLRSNNLTGVLPSELGNLSQLRNLNFSGNNLTGPIPPDLGNLSQLEGVWGVSNELMGPIPPELGNLPKLRKLAFSGNNLTGPIPPELGNLSQLIELDLNRNNLSGPIPPELGNLSQLGYLWVASNKLTGLIPSKLGNLLQLRLLDLSRNNLTGPIPSELGNLSQVEDLWLLQNELTGLIPSKLGDLPKLRNLVLSGNNLMGSIPSELGNLSQLEKLLLSENNLTGPIPSELDNLSQLIELELNRNNLAGPIPPELGNLSQLEKLLLSENNLTGPIPSELGNLSQLEDLLVRSNELIGSIPPELGNLTRLKILGFRDNSLSGQIPSEFGNLTHLRILDLRGNSLSGQIPLELGNLENLNSLWLRDNQFSGGIPRSLGNLKVLQSVDLSNNNNLNGLLPRTFLKINLNYLGLSETGICKQQDAVFQDWWNSILRTESARDCTPVQIERLALIEFYELTNGHSWANALGWGGDAPIESWYGVGVENTRITEISLPSNFLQGTIPGDIANFTELRILNLANNSLAGTLPGEILFLSNLTELRINGNEAIEGIIGEGFIDLDKLRVFHIGGTALCTSPSSRFQAWYTGIGNVSGMVCRNPSEVRLGIPVVYLTQSVQTPQNSLPLIAGRDALLRVFVTGESAPAFFNHKVVATIQERDGEYRVEMTRPEAQLLVEVDESKLSNSFNAVLPGDLITPDMTMVVNVDPDGVIPRAAGSQDRFPVVGEATFNIVSVPEIEVTIVPVVEANDPDLSVFEWTNGIHDNSSAVDLLKYAFPFHEFHATSRESYTTSLDLTSNEGQWGLVLELEVLRLLDNARGHYYAAAASVNGSVRGVARIGGWTSMGNPLDTELAHEVGHNFNLKHAPCGGAADTDPNFPHSGGGVGVWGYNFRDSTLISPDYHRDIMGYCYRNTINRNWLSDYFYEKVIDYRDQVEGKRAKTLADATENSVVLILWGGVRNGELRLEPPFLTAAPAQFPETDGPYSLSGFSQAEIMFSLSFTPDEDKFGNKYFFFAIPIEQSWEELLDRIVLTGPEGNIVTSANDTQELSFLFDDSTGKIRGILRDWNGDLPVALVQDTDLSIKTIRSFKDAVQLQGYRGASNSH